MLPFAVEASWVTSKWDRLDKYLAMAPDQIPGVFNIGIGSALSALRYGKGKLFSDITSELRKNIAKGFTTNSVASLQACHESVLKLHILSEIELIADMSSAGYTNRANVLETLDRRLDILGGCISDKQYILGVRRAAMELS